MKSLLDDDAVLFRISLSWRRCVGSLTLEESMRFGDADGEMRGSMKSLLWLILLRVTDVSLKKCVIFGSLDFIMVLDDNS